MIERRFGKKRIFQTATLFGVGWLFLVLFRLLAPDYFYDGRFSPIAVMFIWFGWPFYFAAIFVEWLMARRNSQLDLDKK